MHDPALTPAPCTAARTGEQPSAHQQRSGTGDTVHTQQTASPEEEETAPSTSRIVLNVSPAQSFLMEGNFAP